MRRFVIIFTLAVILICTISELLLRKFCAQKLKMRHYPAVYMPDSVVGYKYKPDSYDTIVNPAYTSYMWGNEYGNFDEFHVDLNENKDYYRIVFIGASDDIGPYSYIGLIREKFRKLNCRIQIINASVDGALREVERLKFIKEYLLAYEPDMIVFTGWVPLHSNLVYRTQYKKFLLDYSDWDARSQIEEYIENTHYQFSWFKLFFDYSYSFRLICKYYCENDNTVTKIMGHMPLLRNRMRASEYLEQVIRIDEFKNLKRLSMKESYAALRDIGMFLKERNITLVYSQKTVNDQKLKDFILSTGNKYFGSDLETKGDLSYGEADGHTSHEGHKIIAESYFHNLVCSGLIPLQYFSDSIKTVAQLNQ